MLKFISAFFGTKNEREINKLWPRVHAINALEPQIQSLDDQALVARIRHIKQQISTQIADKKERDKTLLNQVLDPHLNEVFAIVREAGRRVLNMRHFDVQLLGGIALHEGKIAEMRTGEGKTLVATLPVVLNSLTGLGVHVVTVNDYLASRDAEWMGRIYRFLDLSVGVVLPNTNERIKKEAYNSDITYGQNNEFGFDYLRDNMKFSLSEYVQREHVFAIVDEVDSILIDEARTPLIISGQAEDSSELYKKTNSIIPKLRRDMDFAVEEKSRAVILTEAGVEKCEQLLGVDNLYEASNVETLHHLNQALRAHALFKRDVDYVIERGQAVIVDEHTGRLMYGRRWSDGLHQAIEAKEHIAIQAENQTLASITFQNYFRMYKKLSGMTGTADTEAEEFAKIYDLDVLVIPTNKPVKRIDKQDQVYKTEEEKLKAIVKDIEAEHAKGRPILVGTVSVEKSEVLSKRLHKLGILHNTLNAKKHRDEAAVVAQAGRLGSVTIATSMAGRGTDIKLGGDPEFMARTQVAKHFGQSQEQVADFAFLSGRADLIDAQELAKRDQTNARYIAQIEEQVQAVHALAAKAKKENKPFEMPENLPKNLIEAQAQVYEERKAFYNQALSLYAMELKKAEDICQAEKEKVIEAGGFHIVGTERHESRRIDNQLRGRSGRQGDPGSSQFYLCLQDDLMRIFGSDRMIAIMERLGMEEDAPIEHPWVSKSIENAQKRVEGFHFDSRKQLLEYDDVMNQQRSAIYKLRRSVLGGEDIKKLIFDLVEKVIVEWVMVAAPERSQPSDWKLTELSEQLLGLFGITFDLKDFKGDRQDLMDAIYGACDQFYTKKEEQLGAEILRQVERMVYLQTMDHRWREHLQAMDHLREGIHFRGYAQKDPKQEYKKEGFHLFLSMMGMMRLETLERIFKAEIRQGDQERMMAELKRLEAAQKEELKRQERQKEKRGEEPMPPADAEMPRFSQKAQAELLNRHQRRMMKAQERHSKGS